MNNNSQHATTEQLLEIRDGIRLPISDHVEGCAICQAELTAIEEITEGMFTQADQRPPREVWQRIRSTLADREALSTEPPMGIMGAAPAPVAEVSVWKTMTGAVYALAASVMFAGVISVYFFGQQNALQQQNQFLQASMNELMLNSRGLEQVRQQVAAQGQILNANHQASIDRLYWRISYLDQQLNAIDLNQPEQALQAKDLWTARVDALNEINKLYYQTNVVADNPPF